MRKFSPEFAAHLESGVTTLCTCWRMTRNDGRVSGFTDHDRDLEFEGTRFRADKGGTLTDIDMSAGFSIDNALIEGVLDGDEISERDLRAGRFDGAALEIWRVNWLDVPVWALIKAGTLGEVRFGSAGFSAEFRGPSHLLAHETGRLYQRGCDAVLGDSRCGVDLSATVYLGHGTILSIPSLSAVDAGDLSAFETGWFNDGVLTYTSGALSGLSFSVRTHVLQDSSANITLWRQMPEVPSTGDTFTLTAGCDKRFATCREKFSNGLNFRGMPHIPGNDFVTSYPVHGEQNTGERLR